jgi:hypothetical protein
LDTIRYDYIGRMESFATDLPRGLDRHGAAHDLKASVGEVVGASPPTPGVSGYDAALADRVYDTYRKDFEAFGYEKDSWRR